MIRSFPDRDTEALFGDMAVRRFRAIERHARRKLLYLHPARLLQDLSTSPGTLHDVGETDGTTYPVVTDVIERAGVRETAA
jgi:plasmid maintenance system killer protein